MNRDNSCTWFHGKISREEAEHRLQQGFVVLYKNKKPK